MFSSMFGPFRSTMPAMGGLLWKIPHTMSRNQKARQRFRMKTVDTVLENLRKGLQSVGQRCSILDRTLKVLPKESEMPSKDKYWIFNKQAKGYRKSAHREPKWTRITNRNPPPNF